MFTRLYYKYQSFKININLFNLRFRIFQLYSILLIHNSNHNGNHFNCTFLFYLPDIPVITQPIFSVMAYNCVTVAGSNNLSYTKIAIILFYALIFATSKNILQIISFPLGRTNFYYINIQFTNANIYYNYKYTL